MTDPLEIPSFCERYHTLARNERPAYVAQELRRVDGAGLPVLRTVLSCADDDAQAHAVQLLHAGVDADGAEILPARLWRLRLAEGAVPPSTDPQGRLLPADRRGKVLVCKIGNKGGRIPTGDNVDPKQIALVSGPSRTTTVRAGRDIYETTEVTSAPRSYSLRNAVLILKAWGVGCTPERARIEPDRDGNPREVQVYWLVEEVLDAPAAQEPARTRKAG